MECTQSQTAVSTISTCTDYNITYTFQQSKSKVQHLLTHSTRQSLHFILLGLFVTHHIPEKIESNTCKIKQQRPIFDKRCGNNFNTEVITFHYQCTRVGIPGNDKIFVQLLILCLHFHILYDPTHIKKLYTLYHHIPVVSPLCKLLKTTMLQIPDTELISVISSYTYTSNCSLLIYTNHCVPV